MPLPLPLPLPLQTLFSQGSRGSGATQSALFRYYAAPQWVTVEGYGFLDSPHLSCMFYAEGGPPVVVSGADVQYVSATEVRCRQPRLEAALPSSSYLDVSVDGQKFSRSLRAYDVLGPPVAVRSNQTTVTAQAADATLIPSFTLYTLDEFGHQVLDFDTGEYEFTATVKVPNRNGDWNISGGAVTSEDGKAKFDSLTLVRPKIGRYDLCLRSALGDLCPAVTIIIVEGVPVALAVLKEPSPSTLNTEPLDIQPEVELHDSAGNPVLNPRISRGHVLATTARVVPGGGRSFDALFSFADGKFVFTDVQVVAGHGIGYRLRFSLWPIAGMPVRATTSHAIYASPCHESQFYIRGQTECSDCPAGAVCNGSAALLTRDNYWRTEGSLAFLPCNPGLGEDGRTRCRGGRPVGTCSAGFTGPLCALCEAGRSGGRCLPCGSVTVAWVMIVGITLGYCALIGVVTYKAFRQDSRSKKSALALEGKIAITYLQTFGILAPVFPTNVRCACASAPLHAARWLVCVGGGGAHRTREPHQGGQGRAQQTRRRGTARRERQLEQREQRTRMERMAERAHGRKRQ